MGTHPIFESDFDCLTAEINEEYFSDPACQNSNHVKFCRAIPTHQMTMFQQQRQPRWKSKRPARKNRRRRKRKKGQEKSKNRKKKRGRSRSGLFHRCLSLILLQGRKRRSSVRQRRNLQVVIRSLQEELTCLA